MIKEIYYWKELTEDGLLKEPKPFGPYYRQDSLNGFDGHENKEEAYKNLEYIDSIYQFEIPSNLILIAQCQVVKSDEEDNNDN